ncbi:hypothetical protein LPTSP4_25970 [Leptospira ryugenii]|uniref:Uncharacterized protein n=1 Tax=Leptospira ryugenii TaxID=1917863 RepID=A0A2P2E2M3_9LEPT|nr:hypothetical protein [Leptospira ryugenii]GBF51066.1 hypothetical protein LPTSP4_25970 [Leptospira ryugenii]
MSSNTKFLFLKATLTVGALEFFGPIFRDTNSSHLLNPEWVGHARFHLMWNISLWAGIGLYSIYKLWIEKQIAKEGLMFLWTLQCLNALAFWNSVILGDSYNADIFDAKIHLAVFEINENIIVFGALSLLLLFNLRLLQTLPTSQTGTKK